MSVETLHRPQSVRRTEDGELLGEQRVMHPAGHKQEDEIIDAEIVEDTTPSSPDEQLAVTKYPTGERQDAGLVEQKFPPEDMAELEKMLAQEALKAELPVPQGSARPTKVVVAHLDQSHDAEAAARRIAEQKVKERAANVGGGRFKRAVKSAMVNLTVPFTYQKARAEALQAIKEHGDIYANVDTTDEKYDAAHAANIDRVMSDTEESLHRGERYEGTKNERFEAGVRDLIRRGANGELSDEALAEEMYRFAAKTREEDGTDELGKGVAYVNNVVDAKNTVLAAIEHGESLESVLENMEVKVGETRAGVRQEHERYSKTNKLVDKLHTNRLAGAVLSPEAAATAGAIAAMAGHLGTSKAFSKSMHALGLVGGVAGAAGLAAARERSHLLAERAHYNEAKAEGQEFDNGERMEEFAYELAGSSELLASLNFESLDLSKKENLEKALEQLGHVEARVALTDETGKNLIKYDDIMDVSEQRWALDIARAEAKCQLRPLVDDPAMLRELGLPEGATFDSALGERVGGAVDVLTEDMTAQDKAFKKWSRWQMAKAAGWAGASSLTFGLVGTEVFAGLSDKTTGMVEKVRGQDGMQETVLAAMAGKLGFGGSGMSMDGATSFADRSFGEQGTMTMPEGMEMQNNPDGTVDVSYGDMKVDGLPLEKNGTLSPEALARLRDQGFQISDLSHMADAPETKTVEGGSLHDFMQANKDKTEHVTRVGWSDNDTARPDENELKIWWGGKDNNGIRSGGGFQFDVSQMTADGSSHDGMNENWKELAKEGKLQMFISPSAGEQTHPFAVSIGPDGKVDIPKDHPATSLFSVRDGQAQFDGKYAEVAQVVGEDEKGRTEIRPLATEVGADTAKDKDYTYTEKTKTEAFKPAYNVRFAGGDGASLDYHPGPGAFVPRKFAGPARSSAVDAEAVPPAPVAPLEQRRQGELEGGSRQPELEPTPVRPELEAARPQPVEADGGGARPLEAAGRSLELAGRPEAPAAEHRDRAALAARRPRVWSPFWQGEIGGGGETPAVEAPVESQHEEEPEQNEDVLRVQEAAREALKSGKMSVSEMERSLRGQLGAGGAYVTVLYNGGRPVDYRITVTDIGAIRLRAFLQTRQTLENVSRRELPPARRELESGPPNNPELEA